VAIANVAPSAEASFADAAAADNAGANPLQSTPGFGARVCKKYVDGHLSNEPLWPWPMDEQMKAAIDFARSRGDHPHDSKFYFGPSGTVTGLVESIWGPIPAACRN
jgi:hypothetical protein